MGETVVGLPPVQSAVGAKPKELRRRSLAGASLCRFPLEPRRTSC